MQHVQIQYASPECEAAGKDPRITLAPKPPQPVDKGLAGPGLLAHIITSKFADHLPLYRLQNIFERNGFEIARSTMCVWAGDVADLARPLFELMKKRVLESHVIGTDDTVLPMQQPGRAKKARIWIYRGDEDHPYNVFDFTTGRGRDGPALFLGDYKGVLLADAYGGYDGICLDNSAVKAGCWAHGRRKFTDAQKLHPAIAAEALALKNYLFVGNERGGRTAAILSSLTSTCRRHDIDPQRYLTQLLTVLPSLHLSELPLWLPDEWKKREAAAEPRPDAAGIVPA